jgi:CheY-like chemotaxis protein
VLFLNLFGITQVTSCRTGRECVQLLSEAPQQLSQAPALPAEATADPTPTRESMQRFDLVLKDHEPPLVDACRLLRRLARDANLRSIPVVGAFLLAQWQLQIFQYRISPQRQMRLTRMHQSGFPYTSSAVPESCCAQVNYSESTHSTSVFNCEVVVSASKARYNIELGCPVGASQIAAGAMSCGACMCS